MEEKKTRLKIKKRKTRKQQIDEKICESLSELSRKRSSIVYTILMGSTRITPDTVSDIYDDLCEKIKKPCKKLDVIVDSGGGDIHSAYHLVKLFRYFAPEELNFIIPRWAKSAATLLICGGDSIFMGLTSEIGPVDPVITDLTRKERFSPLDIESTLSLIRKEFKEGDSELAKGLLERLQFPLTLGSYKKSLQLGKQYLIKLLTTRMFKDEPDKDEKAKKIASTLVESYSDHGFCIDIEEAKEMGLKVEELSEDEWSIVWCIYKLYEEKEKIRIEKKRKEINKILKGIPEDIRKKLMEQIPQTK